MPDKSEIDYKIDEQLYILDYMPFYYGNSDTVPIIYEYKEMAKADPQMEFYNWMANFTDVNDGEILNEKYNETITIEAMLTEIFLNEELINSFNFNSAIQFWNANKELLKEIKVNAVDLGISDESIETIDNLLSISDVSSEFIDAEYAKVSAIILEIDDIKLTKFENIILNVAKNSDIIEKAGNFFDLFSIVYTNHKKKVKNADQLYKLFMSCLTYHSSSKQFQQAVEIMSNSVKKETAKYTGNDEFSQRMRAVGELYQQYYQAIIDESMAEYAEFADESSNKIDMNEDFQFYTYGAKALIVTILTPVCPHVVLVFSLVGLTMDVGVSIWEAVSKVDERALERDKFLNMILFYDAFSNALYSNDGFHGLLIEKQDAESYQTLVTGIKMHIVVENMLIDYAINYSHMLKRALSDWKEEFVLISQSHYVKPVYHARYPDRNTSGRWVKECWKELNSDMRDDDVQLLKLKKVYIDTENYEGVKTIYDLSEAEAYKLGVQEYTGYIALKNLAELYAIFCPVNIIVKNGDKIVAKIENDVVIYNNGKVLINIYKESNYENAYKYIIMPEQYNLEITGYDNGEMSFEKAVIENGSVIEISSIEEVPVTSGSVYREVIEGNKTIALECDLDNNGVIDQTVNAIDEVDAMLGDVNDDGMVDSSDASRVLAEYAEIQTGGAGEFTDIQYKAADVNKDDTVDSSDASRILAYYAAISTGKKPTWD